MKGGKSGISHESSWNIFLEYSSRKVQKFANLS